MMYCTFATMFIAQAYNIELSIGQQITMLLLLMLTSKGMAGVPRASLVVIAATLADFNIPEAGLLLIIGIDQFLDMGRSATNVIGNSLATAVVGKWEGEMAPEPEDVADAASDQETYVAAGRARLKKAGEKVFSPDPSSISGSRHRRAAAPGAGEGILSPSPTLLPQPRSR